MTDKLSIIVPVYKVEEFLPHCLDSLVQQTYQDLEIILVDDGSPDHCGVICDEYAQKDSRIKVIHKENHGMNAARNDGIQSATGEWIAFVDSDDWCDPDYYEKLIQASHGEQYDIVLAGGEFLEYGRKCNVERRFFKPFIYSSSEQIAKLTVNITTYCFPWDRIFRTDFLRENELCFDVTCKAFEDVWFNYQAFSRAASVLGCPNIGYHYRITSINATRGFNPNRFNYTYDVVCKMHDYAECHYPENSKEALSVNSVALSAFSSSLVSYYFNEKNVQPYAVIVKEIKRIKKMPYIKEAIWHRANLGIKRRHLLLKYLSRLPWIWPIRLMYLVNEMRIKLRSID